VFLTPHIIKDAEQLMKLSDNKKMEFARTEDMYKQGEVLVKFKKDVAEERVREIVSKEGAVVVKESTMKGLFLIRLKQGQDVRDGVKMFNTHDEVEYAEPNYIMKIK
jgi:hypothetical protein